MTNNTRRLGAAGVLLSAVFLNVASVQAVVLPTPIQDVTARQYGDFWIYSMALLQVQLNLQDGLQPGDLDKPHSGDYYYIPSSPGQIDNLLVIATGTNNKPTVTNVSFPNTGADDAYPTPSGNSVTSFSTVTTPDPQPADVPPPPNNLRPAFAGDQSVSWDVQLGVLREFCAEDKLVFWFNMNETGTENDLSGQDLLAWAAVTLEDLDGPGGKVTFFLSQDKAASQGGFNPTTGAGGADVAQDGAGANPLDTEWVHVHSDITVDANTGNFLNLGPPLPPGSYPPGVDPRSISQNLGADKAAFAAYNKTLSDLAFTSPLYDVMHVDLRLARIINGYEQLFIQCTPVSDNLVIPEPSSIVLWSLFVAGIGLVQWRRSRRSRA